MKTNEIIIEIKVDTKALNKALRKAKREIQSLNRLSFFGSEEMHCLMFLLCGLVLGIAISLL